MARILVIFLLALSSIGAVAALTQTPEATPTLTPSDESLGCQRPPDDYTRVWVEGRYGQVELNARTLAMLDLAPKLYGGVVDFRLALTQGSYVGEQSLPASFGTHDGGGALDLSVRDPVTRQVLTAEIEPIIHALRIAGFAAWLRQPDELYPGSPIHIHAVAIGDQELSEAARAQIDGDFGYLRGYDGIPREDGIPQPDGHGGPIICHWMEAEGFGDLRAEPTPTSDAVESSASKLQAKNEHA